MQEFEKLGALYIGKRYDNKTSKVTDEVFLYDAKDLTTHGLIVGMTGSGKTGLSIALLEDAAIDGIPAIVIDPKGDLSNLFLTFPDLQAQDFEPWVDAADATRKGMDIKGFSKHIASVWKKGLADWGQDGKRIQKFKDSCELALYTPGNTSGRPIRVLNSFAAPAASLLEDKDALRERVTGVVSGLLSLIGLNTDPIRSREHILISNLINKAWMDGKDYELGQLIADIQNPPFTKLGVMDLESFFSAKDRMDLSMVINSLLASPGFSAWMEGEALDINSLLYAKDGKPKLSILSIAHLSEQERMFFVSLFLNEMVSWVRSQPGTSSLRALLYMDEVAGYFPPTANPPSKPPMLTLLKQARAHGLGVLLATQNPVDLDYKGLSNMGTWFLGRLQTERDKARVLDGLEGASGAGFNRKEIDKLLSGLKSRVFLINNVHEDHPELFHTRWVLSYLRGPLTREQIKMLAGKNKPTIVSATEKLTKEKQKTASRPIIQSGIVERFIPITKTVNTDSKLIYRPALQSKIQLHFVHSKSNLDLWQTKHVLQPIHGSVSDNVWIEMVLNDMAVNTLTKADDNVAFAEVMPEAMRSKSYTTWQKQLKTIVYQVQKLQVFHCPTLKHYSSAGQSESEFKANLGLVLREHRDFEIEKLRKKYAPKIKRIEDRINTQQAVIEREQSEHKGQKMQAMLSVGATVIGALFGRKLTSASNVSKASTAIRKSLGLSKSGSDIDRAEEKLAGLAEDLAQLDEEFKRSRESLDDSLSLDQLQINTIEVKPRKTDLEVGTVNLVWVPWIIDSDGIASPAY